MLLVSLLITALKDKGGHVVVLVLFLGGALGVYWVARKFATQIVELTAHSDYLEIRWIKLPLFSLKQDQAVLWKDMKSFAYEWLRYNYQLKIFLKPGRTIRFLDEGSKLEATRQLESFYNLLKNKSVKFATDFKNEPGLPPLIERKTFLSTRFGIVIAFLAAFAMIVAFVLIPILSDDEETLREWKLGVFYIVLLVAVGIVASYVNRRKKRKKPGKRTSRKKI
jgi:hypothetical protein